MLPTPRRSQEALQYLHALQLLVLIIHPAASIAAPRLSPTDLEKLEGTFSQAESIYIIAMFEVILNHVDLKPLQVILTEAFRLTEWGHYIAYYDNKKLVIQKLNKKVLEAFQYLREGNVTAFADGITDCYRYILKRAKEYMIKNTGFTEPPIYRFQKNTNLYSQV